jgi:hypothetical protein
VRKSPGIPDVHTNLFSPYAKQAEKY